MFHGIVSKPLLLPTLVVAGDAGVHRVVAAVISAHLASRSAPGTSKPDAGVIAYTSIKSDSPQRRQHPHDNSAPSPSFLSFSLVSHRDTLLLPHQRAGSRNRVKMQIYRRNVVAETVL